MVNKAELEAKIEAAKAAVEEAEEELEEYLSTPQDVTNEVTVSIGTDSTGIRAYFEHDGQVIVRAGMGKGAELTSFATTHGYTLKQGRMGQRGAFFQVFKTNS